MVNILTVLTYLFSVLPEYKEGRKTKFDFPNRYFIMFQDVKPDRELSELKWVLFSIISFFSEISIYIESKVIHYLYLSKCYCWWVWNVVSSVCLSITAIYVIYLFSKADGLNFMWCKFPATWTTGKHVHDSVKNRY